MMIMGLHITTKAKMNRQLFDRVDEILATAGMQQGDVHVTMAVQQQAAAHALRKMMNGSLFSVCTIRDVMEMCQGQIATQRMAVYSSMHCVKWADMDTEFRQQLVAMVLDDFRHVLTWEHNDEIVRS
jgi:hypothetical protein